MPLIIRLPVTRQTIAIYESLSATVVLVNIGLGDFLTVTLSNVWINIRTFKLFTRVDLIVYNYVLIRISLHDQHFRDFSHIQIISSFVIKALDRKGEQPYVEWVGSGINIQTNIYK